jgi:chorismate-pyruvate lyase
MRVGSIHLTDYERKIDTHRAPLLDTLCSLFYAASWELGDFSSVAASEMPREIRLLLAHDQHMTVAVERHHGCEVDVRVLDKRVTPSSYARKIILLRQSDHAVVQFGIMRVGLQYLDNAVRREIESESAPLGRVLIAHHVLRRVELVALYRVTPGEELRKALAMTDAPHTFGRTARIHVAGQPAVELLEIVAPA